MLRSILHICLLLIAPLSAASGQSVALQGIVNHYAAVLNYDSCTATLQVDDTTGFRLGQTILVHHTQGAEINTTNTGQYGVITQLQQAGWIEKAVIIDREWQQIRLEHRLLRPVLPSERVQLITFPQYAAAVVTDTLRPAPWNGTKGGVLALSVTGVLTLNAPVLASGAGFRGGASYIAPNNNCSWLLAETGYVYALGNWRGGSKGEGVALGTPGQELGRGPRANGGGGGNDHNSGGGGGGNAGTGGDGGNNNEPSTFGCDGFYPGLGGKSLNNPPDRLFLGGGGGAGHTNNTNSSDGGHGGGIVLIDAGQIDGSQPIIRADGLPGATSNGDGGGGGGAGGCIWLQAGAPLAALQLSANGGQGGNASGNNGNRCFGPGGGGGGGAIFTNVGNATTSVLPGLAGTVINAANACNGSANGADAGEAGLVQPSGAIPQGAISAAFPALITSPASVQICAQETLMLSSSTQPTAPQIQWQWNNGAGWNDLPDNQNTLAIPTPPAGWYRCVHRWPGCFEIVSDTAEVQVTPAPVANFTIQTLTPQSFQFNSILQNQEGFLWQFGDGAESTQPAPTHFFATNGLYEVSLTAWNACDTVVWVQTVTVALPPAAAFEVPATISACNTALLTCVNQSVGADTYFWQFPGAVPAFSTEAQPTVQYNVSGDYEVTLIAYNSVGSDTFTAFVNIQIIPVAVADFDVTDLGGGTGVQFTFTGSNALFYTWQFGDGTPNVSTPSPLHIFPAAGVYTVRLTVQNACGASVLEQVITVTDENVSASALGEGGRMRIWPNPAGDGVWIDAGEEPAQIAISDMLGKIRVLVEHDGQGPAYLSVDDWPAGCYQVRTQSDGRQYTALLMIQR